MKTQPPRNRLWIIDLGLVTLPTGYVAAPRSDQGLRQLLRDLADLLDRLDVPMKGRFRVELVVEEIATNLVKYGVLTSSLTDEVRVDLTLKEGQVSLAILDTTEPFSPLDVADPAKSDRLEDVIPGGLGLSLVRQSCDALSYDSAEGKNTLHAHFNV